MDYKSIEEIENGVVIREAINFELKHIFDCGQCFRWKEQSNGNYIGVAYGKVIEVEKKKNDVYIYNTNLEDTESIWIDYFDLKRDYSQIKEELSKDELLKISVEYGHGIRLLRQEPFELLISFIISSNNRIPMIKKCIDNISRRWGNAVSYGDETCYTFPSIYELNNASLEELQACSTGFRAKYIKDTVDKIYRNLECKETYERCMDLEWIKLQDDDNCHGQLCEFMGVGPKVADCIMLFSMQKYSAFPVDVWVKRAMQHFYMAPDSSLKKIREFGRDKFGFNSGFAQQYLFYYARENNINI